MAEVDTAPWRSAHSAHGSVTVYPLAANKRPVGFADWPEEPKPRKKRKRKHAAS